MNTADVNFYTVKQIDDFLNTDEIIAQSTSDNRKWFALEHTRNILIDRLKTRLAIANGCDGAIAGSKRADVLLDKGFHNYETLCKHIRISYCCKVPVRPSKETEDSLRLFMAALLDNIAGISNAKFVFSDESAEILINTDDGLELSFELFYDSLGEMIVHAGIPNGTTRDGHPKYDFLATTIPAFSESKALEFHRKAIRENMTRKALSLVRGIAK
jgi:hypothetical protein